MKTKKESTWSTDTHTQPTEISDTKPENILKISLIVVAFIIFSTKAFATDECNPNGYDVCYAARKIVAEYTDSLPMKLSQNITIEKAFALKNIIHLTAALGYGKNYLEEVVSNKGGTIEELNNQIIASTKTGICQEQSPTRAFVSLGGQIHYFYKFADGMPYLTVSITECDKMTYPVVADTWDSQNWRIESLNQQESKAVVLLVRGYFNINYERTVAHNLKKQGKDYLWALKVFSRANYNMSKVAATANWPEMETYFLSEAANAADLIKGDVSSVEYKRLCKNNEKILGKILKKEKKMKSKYQAMMEPHKDIIDEIGKRVVGDAKLHATE